MPRVFAAIALAVGLIGVSSKAVAVCNFPTHAYSKELANPSQIEAISVEISNSRKWFKNSISILTSKKKFIDDRLKDKFRSTVTVNYSFGNCTYPARVRQNGDYKDHIKLLKGGNVVSSLDVKLLEGNILNAVRFKLLLPETRGGVSEVLGALMLRELGYIAPETFLVPTDINGVSHLMLFQENAEKELLERNHRREGPIFEGDERILWDVKGFDLFELEDIALARQTNDNWAKKGSASAQISLAAFKKIQSAYLHYVDELEQVDNYFGIQLAPNVGINSDFEDYSILLIAMNGVHSLRPHNRKFYFNSFTQSFEPIYYDGNLNVLRDSHLLVNPGVAKGLDFFLRNASPDIVSHMADGIEDLRSRPLFKQAFLDRIDVSTETTETLFNDGLMLIAARMRNLHGQMLVLSSTDEQPHKGALKQVRERLLERTRLHEFDTRYVEIIELSESDAYTARAISGAGEGDSWKLLAEELVEIISDNSFDSERVVLLPDLVSGKEEVFRKQPFLNGEIVLSLGAKIDIDFAQRSMLVTQDAPDDWVLVRSVTLNDWNIVFEGAKQESSLYSAQRFNEFGLTGCVNFYDVVFESSSITGRQGQCEDSINIVSSNGRITELLVENGYADAIDIDFGQIAIDRLKVLSTGNDCFDVSTGNFKIENAMLIDCGDKGLSVGENSRLKAEYVRIEKAAIGISSKDYSETRVSNYIGNEIEVCVEAFQKKQEFGGGALFIDNYKCAGDIDKDESSSIVLNGVSP